MSFKKIYNEIGSKYDDRYVKNKMNDIGFFINKIIVTNHYRNVLEIGCGTGHWLKYTGENCNTFGLDISLQMLRTAKTKNEKANLLCCDANYSPIKTGTFDFVFIINAIHMFTDKANLLNSIKRIIKPEGKILIVSIDPTDEDFEMYIYDFFEGIRNFDLERFTPINKLITILLKEGFSKIETFPLLSVSNKFVNGKVWDDIFLQKHNSSQLAHLTQTQYNQGKERIKMKIDEAERNNFDHEFKTHLTFHAVTASV